MFPMYLLESFCIRKGFLFYQNSVQKVKGRSLHVKTLVEYSPSDPGESPGYVAHYLEPAAPIINQCKGIFTGQSILSYFPAK